MKCSICFESMEEDNYITMNCSHNFHMQCIDNWIDRKKKSCPICRGQITEYFSNDERTKIIYIDTEESDSIIDISELNEINNRYLLSRFFNFIMFLLIIYGFYTLINKTYINFELNNSLELCIDNMKNLTIDYSMCIDSLNDKEYLNNIYMYDSVNQKLEYCSVPTYYILKCFNPAQI